MLNRVPTFLQFICDERLELRGGKKGQDNELYASANFVDSMGPEVFVELILQIAQYEGDVIKLTIENSPIEPLTIMGDYF